MRDLRQRRRENPYVAGLIRELLDRPGGVHRGRVISTLENARRSQGLSIPEKFEETVQSAYNQHCVDSSVFLRRGGLHSEGLFFAVGGKGSGYWGVFPDRAKAWLAEREQRTS